MMSTSHSYCFKDLTKHIKQNTTLKPMYNRKWRHVVLQKKKIKRQSIGRAKLVFAGFLMGGLILFLTLTNVKFAAEQPLSGREIQSISAFYSSIGLNIRPSYASLIQAPSLLESLHPLLLSVKNETTRPATSTTTTNNSNLLPWPKRIFVCGKNRQVHGSLLFPTATLEHYRRHKRTRANVTNLVVVGMHGQCGKLPTLDHTYFQNRFPGKAIFFNNEPYGDARGNNTYQVGVIPDSDRSLSGFYYAAFALALTFPNVKDWDRLFVHEKKPKNTGKHGVIYAASNCLPFRQEAAERISKIDEKNLKVYYGGKCQAQGVRRRNQQNIEAATNMTASRQGNGIYSNWKDYNQYRYCLVMENTSKSGYITEKIILAFLGGCVPIYYGTTEIFDIFNKDAFIFYDIHNPELALEKIRFMEKENRTAYNEMLSQPILVNGTDTIERYFSVHDHIGGGKLIRKIRVMLGYDPNPPPT